ncbi:hypothetical protein [Fusibacter sp. 3D3]|uniref:hypothetical protein n=1 Tax=Fusibacter sp. 3D3 TaxID=1048380 RepID=UPI0008532815|nr:hypothetical protein [Fusibacter sp. 3D3]GAU79580.1 hypothetical protein F3D3_4244 [Fusibacter sp. 3D3]
MSNITKVTKVSDDFLALITWLTKPNDEEIRVIKGIVKNEGVRALFINITSLQVSNELKSKLIDLKNVIIAFDGDISEGGE